MPKLIGSVSYNLAMANDEIERLGTKNSELQAEVVELKAVIKRHNLKLPGTKLSRTDSKDARDEKSYLASTKASRSRYEKPEPQPTSGGEETQNTIEIGNIIYQYKDGALVELFDPMVTIDNRHFNWSTASSFSKKRPTVTKRDPEEEMYQQLRSEEEYENWLREGEELKRERQARSMREETELMEREREQEPLEETLSERSGLNKDMASDLNDAPLRSQIIYDHLKRALRLSQEILFDGFTLYLPGAVRELQGPHEFPIGRIELERKCLSLFAGKGRKIAGRDVSQHTMSGILDDITKLRNTVCHFGSSEASYYNCQYDDILKDAHKLAVFFSDERAAFRARSLRDDFIRQVNRSLEEVEGLWYLSHLPGACPWRQHHVQRFVSLNAYNANRRDLEGYVMEITDRAARDWAVQRHTSGRGDWDPNTLFQDDELI
ncbi:hypothetical protein F4781DRAFT_286408 [Annulohypoxylon bovei var. microspora]|nr:hypothetical protein F4781DRAFT_286408 [Annulohypoxylon bovei var. microspora]